MDVDGVIVGNKIGVNFPLPHTEVIQKLKQVHSRNISVILCTGKFNSAILDIIWQAKLNNPHITDGGALILDPINNKIIKKYSIEKNILKSCVESCLKQNIYIELYTAESYFIQKKQVSDFTLKREDILQTKPVIVDSLDLIIDDDKFIKVIAFAKDKSEMPKVEAAIKHLRGKISSFWSFHPYIDPCRPCVITASNVSKANAVKETLKNLKLSFEESLGIGDSQSDWGFIKQCKYAATLDNGDSNIKKLVKTKGSGNFLIARHIDKNGIFDILKYFSLIN